MQLPINDAPIAPSTINVRQKADAVIKLGDEMVLLLEQEIDFAGRRSSADYGTFIKRKQQLLLDYQGAVKALLAERQAFDELPAGQRAQLRAAGSRLDAVARQNAEKLSVTAAATHKVLQVIIDAARKDALAKQPQSYSPNMFNSYKDDRAPVTPAVFVAEKA